MECKKCYMPIEATDRFCPYCGAKRSSLRTFSVILLAFFSFIIGSFLMFLTAYSTIPFLTNIVFEHDSTYQDFSPNELRNTNIDIELIEHTQQTVYTIFTDDNQGSGFLFDSGGYVITNAHVVEGSLNPVVRTKNGREFEGNLIGYSNEIDVALIHVPQLTGEIPFPQEFVEEKEVGIEVATLGTPLGKENTATFGYLTGVNRTFHLPPHKFKNVYQISAPIEPGNSGGPLLSMSDGKIIAINAAKRIDVDNIAFSIPLNQVVPLVNEWIQNPMSKTEITSLFYDEDGNLYYDLLWTLLEQYFFDDGFFLDDEEYHDYWYFEEQWDYNDKFDTEYDDIWYYNDEYDTEYDDNWDWDDYDDWYYNEFHDRNWEEEIDYYFDGSYEYNPN